MNRSALGFGTVAGVSGIGFATTILLVNALVLVPAGFPSPGQGAEEAATFFADGRAAIRLSSLFLPLAWVLATIFAAGAVAASRRSETAGGDAWSLVGLGGILLQNGCIAVVGALRVALAHRPAAELIGPLWELHDSLFVFNGTFLALALVGLSVAGARSHVISSWLLVVGLVAALLQLVSASLTPWVVAEGGAYALIGLVGWLLWVVWLVAYGVALVRASSSPAAEIA